MAPEDDPSGKKGDVLTIELTVLGIPCLGLNGAVPPTSITKQSHFRSQPTDQAETDRYWNAIVGNGSEESERLVPRQMGVSWQITPVALTKAIIHSDPSVASALSMQ